VGARAACETRKKTGIKCGGKRKKLERLKDIAVEKDKKCKGEKGKKCKG
jgi:hypothetical protein